jgi:hypothetical protein
LLGVRVVAATPSYGDTSVWVDGTPAAVTNLDGWFAVLGVSPGTHTVEARFPGALPSRGSFYVPPGRVLFIGATRLVLGDVYANNVIDIVDAELVQAAFGRCRADRSYQAFLDLNRDGCINQTDYDVLYANLGRTGPTAWALSPP